MYFLTHHWRQSLIRRYFHYYSIENYITFLENSDAMSKWSKAVFLILLFIAIAIASFTFLCPQNCKLAARPLNAIGKFSDLVGESETHNIYLFSVDFRWNGTAYVQEKKDAKVRVIIPKEKAVNIDRIYEISVQKNAPEIRLTGIAGILYSTVYKLYYADAAEEYDEIVLNYPKFYNYCWDYDCASKSLPFPKIEKPVRRLFLSSESSGAFLKGARINRIIPAKGNITIAVVFLYDVTPMPEERLSSLKGTTNTTRYDAFNYVPVWYKERADEIFQRNNAINMSITFFDTQLKAPLDQMPASYSSCTAINFREFILTQLPEVKKYDALVQFYYTGNASSGILCSPHPVGRDSIFMHAIPETLEASYYHNFVVSLAHELAHLFGASDKYTESGAPENYGSGCFVESNVSKELGKDIMCHRVAEYKNDSFAGFINPPLSGLIINEITAKEIGWYDLDKDSIFEVEDPCPLDKSNKCTSTKNYK